MRTDLSGKSRQETKFQVRYEINDKNSEAVVLGRHSSGTRTARAVL